MTPIGLPRRKPLPRSSVPLARTPLNRVSAKQGKRMREAEKVYALVRERSGGKCEAGFFGCWGRATQYHHRKLRSQGGKETAGNLLHLCTFCHNRVHDYPELAAKLGLIVRRHSCDSLAGECACGDWHDPKLLPEGGSK